MRLSATTANKQGVKFSISKLRSRIEDCNKSIGKALYHLYELGCLSSPTVYDDLSIKNILVHDFEDEVGYLCSNIDGSLKLETLRLKYAYKISKNADFKEIVEALYSYYKGAENLASLDKTLSMVLSQKAEVVSFNPKASVSESIISYRTQLPFHQRIVRDSIIADEGYVTKRFSLSFIVYKSLCNVVGIPVNALKEAVKSNKAIFIDGITLTEELEFIPLLIAGDLNLPTENGNLLSERVMDYYKDARDDSEVTYGKTTFENMVLIKSFKARMKYVENKRAELCDNLKECLVSQYDIYFQIKGMETIRPKESSVVGNYVIDHINKVSLSRVNSLKGFTGEFISESDCSYLKLKSKGIPVSLTTQSIVDDELVSREKLFYNISQLTNSDGSPISSIIGTEYILNAFDLATVAKNIGTNMTNLRAFLYSKCNPVLSPPVAIYAYKNAIADVAELLLKVDCGCMDCEYTGDLDDAMLNQVCYEAEILLKSLGVFRD